MTLKSRWQSQCCAVGRRRLDHRRLDHRRLDHRHRLVRPRLVRPRRHQSVLRHQAMQIQFLCSQNSNIVLFLLK